MILTETAQVLCKVQGWMLLAQFERAHALLVMHTTCTILFLRYLTDTNHSPLITIANVCFGIHENIVSMLIFYALLGMRKSTPFFLAAEGLHKTASLVG